MSYPNQKMIRVHRASVEKGSGKTKPFLLAYQANLKEAMKRLSGTGFKAYMMLVFNTDQYQTAYSPQYISAETGMCLDSARKALKELTDKGFLIDGENSHFDFYEEPPQKKISIKAERKEFIDEDTGEILSLTYEELLNAVGQQAVAEMMWREAK